jgi:hypothetical protein
MDAAMFKAQKNASSCTVRYSAQHCWYYFSKHVAYCLFKFFICLITHPTYTTIGITEPLTHSVYVPQQHFVRLKQKRNWIHVTRVPPGLKERQLANWDSTRSGGAGNNDDDDNTCMDEPIDQGYKITTLKMWHEETNSGKNMVDWSPCFHLYPEGNVVCTHSTYNCFTQMF